MIKATNIASRIPQAPAATEGIRDIKAPIPIPNVWEWVWWGLGTLAVLAVLYFLWRYWQQRRSRILVAPPIPAHIRAKQKLEEALTLITRPKPFCILVSDTIRLYLEERFDFHAPERTTEEFLRELRSTDLLSPDQKESLGRFLENCDLVKFARYEPGENELRELHGAAVKLVEQTEPREIRGETGGPGVLRVGSAVTPDSLGAPRFQREPENSTRDAREPRSEIVNRKS